MKNCLKCHFLTKEHRDESGATHSFSLKPNERSILEADPVGFERGWYSYKCFMGVWDDGVSPLSKEEDSIVFSMNRNNSCFFIEYKPSMLFPAAIELQKREQENRNLKKSYKYSIIGLWLAAIGLILNAVFGIVKN
jgi:hypothetical protein